MLPRKKKITCPRCGTEVEEPVKTWQLVAPIPDRKGRITITIMGSFECPKCGHKWRGVVSKIKVGGSSIEVGGKEIKEEEEEKRPPKIIELDLSDLDELDEEEI
ncbi:chromatin protein Cren7 [Desulfurococcaceae archaeon MEX13E-LK6-19]|nr:chromatin protein Cren7 [Desulfurococcaceae archaeon MEX13E-LK6-19]